MRFSTHLADTTPFIRVLASIEHLQKRIVVHANQDEVRLVVCPLVDGDKSDSCPVEAYVRISVKDDKSVFSEYMIESKRDNNIYFVIDVKALSQAFKGVDKGPVRLKLTRKNANNYLSLRSESGPNSICQDVPIDMTSHTASELEEWSAEPSLSDPRVKVKLPNLKMLYDFTDRMKEVSATVEIEGCNAGTFSVAVRGVDATVSSRFTGLGISSNLVDAAVANESSTLLVKLRKLQSILHAKNMQAQTTVGCFVENLCFVLYCKMRVPINCTYYLPAIVDT